MTKNHTSPSYTEVRRQDRVVTDEAWIKAFLHRAPYGVLATSHEGQPFINTNLFVYDEAANAIYLHGARVGRTPANIKANGRVCFSISEMGRLLPAGVALDFSVEFAGVTVFGTITILADEAEQTHALQMLLDKYCPHLRPGEDYRAITREELRRTAVYRLDIEQWSGKQKQVEADFPGAFFYGEQPS